MAGSRSFSRRERVAEQIRRELADLIHSELRDPRVGMVSLTEVAVSADYAHAKVYFSSLAGSDQLDSVLAGLEHAAGFLRTELGKRISIHMTPQLHFIFDQSLERGAQLSRLISEAAAISDHGEHPEHPEQTHHPEHPERS
ncbi:MAG: 30S ribosome-binding factor RbfA [Candidatus Accumulibacter sp.]|nr:30S ribosome-binding factor RbfA [Candidatus Accumulibacter conexus]